MKWNKTGESQNKVRSHSYTTTKSERKGISQKMMESNEPPIIQYEEILLPDEPDKDPRPSTSEEHDSDDDVKFDFSSSEEEDDEDSFSMTKKVYNTNDPDKSDDIRNETISTILDCIFVPRKIKKNGANYLLRLSRQAPSRKEIIELNKTFETVLKERQVRMNGFCPIRRELYDLLFDELIRQATINCAERGSLLLRVRDEFLMTIASYEKLYDSGVEYGSRKALEAEIEQRRVEIQYNQLKEEATRAEKRIKDLEAEIEAEETLSRQRNDLKQTRHQERMEFLRKLNKQLQEQLSFIS